MRGIPITFLLTDNQIVNEKFLVFINDLLSTGYVADLCTPVRGHPAHAMHVSASDVRCLKRALMPSWQRRRTRSNAAMQCAARSRARV